MKRLKISKCLQCDHREKLWFFIWGCELEKKEIDDMTTIPGWCPLEDAEPRGQVGNIPGCNCGALPEMHSKFCPLYNADD